MNQHVQDVDATQFQPSGFTTTYARTIHRNQWNEACQYIITPFSCSE